MPATYQRQAGADSRPPYHRRRHGVKTEQHHQAAEALHASGGQRSSGCGFLKTVFDPVIRTEDGEGLRLSRENYRRLLDDCKAFCRTAGKPCPLTEDTVPERGLLSIHSFLSSFVENLGVYRDDESNVHMFQKALIDDGWSGHSVPVGPTYIGMRPEFGLLVRRFIKALFIGLGLPVKTCEMPTALYREWIFEMTEAFGDDDDNFNLEQIKEFFSDDPQSPASRISEFDDIVPLSVDELRSFRTESDDEKELTDFMLSGVEFFGSETGISLPALAEFEGADVIDDDDIEAAEFLPVCDYFGILWSIEDEGLDADFVAAFIKQANEDAFNSGSCPQGLVLNREIGADGPADIATIAAKRGLDFLDDLSYRINKFRH